LRKDSHNYGVTIIWTPEGRRRQVKEMWRRLVERAARVYELDRDFKLCTSALGSIFPEEEERNLVRNEAKAIFQIQLKIHYLRLR
jgi:hypothetical protein